MHKRIKEAGRKAGTEKENQVKLTRMVGLAMVAAIAAMALVGFSAGTASATVLCKKLESPCAAANQWPENTTVVAESKKAVLLGTLAVTCASKTTVVAEKNDASEILGKITALSWSPCEGCTEVTTAPAKLPISGILTLTTADKGLLTTTSTTEVILKKCPLGISCTATATSAKLVFDGGKIGSTAKALADKVPVALSGGFGCGTKGEWDACETNIDGCSASNTSTPYIVTSVNGNTTGEIWVEN